MLLPCVLECIMRPKGGRKGMGPMSFHNFGDAVWPHDAFALCFTRYYALKGVRREYITGYVRALTNGHSEESNRFYDVTMFFQQAA